MADENLRQQAMQELARRELAKRQAPRAEPFADRLNRSAASALQGIPAGDELAAFLSPGGRPYQQDVELMRGQAEQFSQEHPYGAMANQLATGLLAGAATGGASKLVGAASMIPKAAGPISRLVQAMGIGGATGAAYGAGSGEGGYDRLDRALEGGATGALTGGALSAGASTIGALAKPLARKMAELGERGAAGNVVSNGLPRLSDAEKALVGQMRLRNIGSDDMTSAGKKLASELSRRPNSPYNLTDALDDEAATRFVKFLRSTPEAQNTVGQSLVTRKNELAQRLGAGMSKFAKPGSPSVGQRRLTEALQSKVDDLTDYRTRATSPYYQKAEPRIVPKELLKNVADSEIIQSATGNIPKKFPRYAGAKENSVKMLHRAKLDLDDLIADAVEGSGGKKKFLAKDLMDLKTDLVSALQKTSPDYKKGQEGFKILSRNITKLTGGGAGKNKVRGLYADLLKKGLSQKPDQIGRELMDLPPEHLVQIRKTLGGEYQADLRAGLRGFIESKLGKENPAQVSGIGNTLAYLGKPDTKNKIQAILGTKDAKRFYKMIDPEIQMAKTNRAAFEGSPTSGNQQALSSLGGAIKKVLTLRPSEAIDEVMTSLTRPKEAQVMSEMAQVLVRPKAGQESVQKIAAWLKAAQEQEAKIGAAADTASAIGAGGSGFISGR